MSGRLITTWNPPNALDDVVVDPPIQSNPTVEEADGRRLQSIHPGVMNGGDARQQCSIAV